MNLVNQINNCSQCHCPIIGQTCQASGVCTPTTGPPPVCTPSGPTETNCADSTAYSYNSKEIFST